MKPPRSSRNTTDRLQTATDSCAPFGHVGRSLLGVRTERRGRGARLRSGGPPPAPGPAERPARPLPAYARVPVRADHVAVVGRLVVAARHRGSGQGVRPPARSAARGVPPRPGIRHAITAMTPDRWTTSYAPGPPSCRSAPVVRAGPVPRHRKTWSPRGGSGRPGSDDPHRRALPTEPRTTTCVPSSRCSSAASRCRLRAVRTASRPSSSYGTCTVVSAGYRSWAKGMSS